MKYAQFFFVLCFLITACTIISSEESPKCIGCNIFLKKRENKKFDLVFKKSINSSEEKLVESSVSSIYSQNCYFMVERKGLYSAIHVTDLNIVDKIDFRNYNEAFTYFRKNVSKEQELKFDDCSDLYNILLPRTICK